MKSETADGVLGRFAFRLIDNPFLPEGRPFQKRGLNSLLTSIENQGLVAPCEIVPETTDCETNCLDVRTVYVYTYRMNKQRIALYTRVSTRDKGQDTENQLRQLREFCSRQEWTIVSEYVEHLSGKNGNREQFQEVFAAASRREFDIVLFWALDRFSREGVLSTLQYLQRLTSYGVGFRSFTEQYLDSCGLFKDAVISILATIAKQERIRLSERTIAGLERAKSKGRNAGRPRVICNREEVLALHQAGESLGKIATALNLTKATVYRIVNQTAGIATA
jgi:DNA invertase Pin-like site-specific DNA recombinase